MNSQAESEIWFALESARRFIASYADQLQGADAILRRIDVAFETARAAARAAVEGK